MVGGWRVALADTFPSAPLRTELTPFGVLGSPESFPSRCSPGLALPDGWPSDIGGRLPGFYAGGPPSRVSRRVVRFAPYGAGPSVLECAEPRRLPLNRRVPRSPPSAALRVRFSAHRPVEANRPRLPAYAVTARYRPIWLSAACFPPVAQP